jgi:hypothetical protein
MASTSVTIHVIPWGETRTGIWCEKCLLPSAIEQDVLFSAERCTVGRRTFVICTRCETAYGRNPT